ATFLAAYTLLITALGPSHGGMLLVMLGLAVFGIGQGLFTAPNNSAIMGAAPESFTGEVGGMLNLMRAFGMSIGIAAGSALLSWRLHGLSGSGNTTITGGPLDPLAAPRGGRLCFVGCATSARLLSLAPAGPGSSPR